ncbi:uncharacterized protein [Rutidosis leptorrhynchoides]|uniref:uncharacterized protein n=1 Tax=Rutidosis leptorrhynchoides TaxID=125765 RepID=UPI003A99184E
MKNAYKMFDFIIDDSVDEKVVNFVKSLTEEKVKGEAISSRVPRTRVYISRDREEATVRERPDAVGRQSLTILQKCTAVIRQIAYGTTPDMFDEYIRIGAKTAALCLDNFCRCVFHLFAPVYLRKPTAGDVARLYNFHAQKHGLPKVTAPPSPFNLTGHHYERGYYLGDGIYPDWAMLVKAPHNPINEQRKKFKRFQESARKDIECTFGVLQGRFAMLKIPKRFMDFNKIKKHMYACVVLHNMIQENNGFVISKRDEKMIALPSNRPIRLERNSRDRDARIKEIRDRQVHNRLESDLTEHVWNLSPYFRNANINIDN